VRKIQRVQVQEAFGMLRMRMTSGPFSRSRARHQPSSTRTTSAAECLSWRCSSLLSSACYLLGLGETVRF
jgi:hypothetical protein